MFYPEDHHDEVNRPQRADAAPEAFRRVVGPADSDRRRSVAVLVALRQPTVDIAIHPESQIERARHIGNRQTRDRLRKCFAAGLAVGGLEFWDL
jgi:hypothetical protein